MTDAAGTRANTRELVVSILLEITRDGAYSHKVIGEVLEKYQYLPKKDRAFITRVVDGTLENRIQIDDLIDRFSKVPVKKQRPVIRCILQSAVYQICYLDAVPDAAACNEAVALAKKKGFRNLSGFVNGVLRTISRNKGQVQLPDPRKEPERYLSIRYSIPEWMIRMWKTDFSYDWALEADWQQMQRMLQAFQTPAPLVIRTNESLCTPQGLQARLKAEGVEAKPLKELPYAFQISGYDYLGALESFREGLFYIQDISSMLAVEAARPKAGDFVLDVCAAPGGKAVHTAQLLRGTGRVLARDLTEEKAALLLQNKNRCRVSNMQVQVWDARILDTSLSGQADIVLADLPCSGLGVMRRKKDIRDKMTPEKMQGLVELQREILATVCAYVRPGGRLVYSTCTIHRAENEENAQWFAQEHPQFRLESSRQLLPGDAYGDGFYIAVFKRREIG